MGLLFRRGRPIARLAVVGAGTNGTGTSTGTRTGKSTGKSTGAAAAETGAAPAATRPVYVAPPPASTGAEVDELGRLAQMHSAGALTDAEFAAAKAQLLDL